MGTTLDIYQIKNRRQWFWYKVVVLLRSVFGVGIETGVKHVRLCDTEVLGVSLSSGTVQSPSVPFTVTMDFGGDGVRAG